MFQIFFSTIGGGILSYCDSGGILSGGILSWIPVVLVLARLSLFHLSIHPSVPHVLLAWKQKRFERPTLVHFQGRNDVLFFSL